MASNEVDHTLVKKAADLKNLRRLFGNNLMWVATALLVLVILLLVCIRIGRVEGTEVGILLNKVNGKLEVIPQSGVRLYNGITHEFYVLQKTLQTLDMTGKESLKIKTIDGSDVFVALKVQYRIIPEQAEEVLFTSGPGGLLSDIYISLGNNAIL